MGVVPMNSYQQALLEQKALLQELVALDAEGENFPEEFDRLATALATKTKELDALLQQRPGLRRELGFVS